MAQDDGATRRNGRGAAMLLRRWTDGRREAPEPLEGDVPRTVAVLTAGWFVLLLVQLPFYGWFADHGHVWWLWSCLTGGLLGLYGLWLVRRRERAIRRRSDTEAAGHHDSDH